MTSATPTRLAPTAEQRAVLSAGASSMRIAAGAGTGKTTTISLLVESLVSSGLHEPEQILGLTFTNKAAAELSDRLRTAAGGLGRDCDVNTYHGFAAGVVSEFGALVGIERESALITPAFSRQIILEVLANTEAEFLNIAWASQVDRVVGFGSALADHLVDVAFLRSSNDDSEVWIKRLEYLDVWESYVREKRRLGVVDYADLISTAVRVLETFPEVAERIRARYRLVLLDEYQDTNPAQRVMLQKLFGDGFPVVAVGDTDQTIYEWRGATPANFDNFGVHFPLKDGTPAPSLPLTLNQRSDRRIIDTANAVRSEIGSGSDPLEARPTADEGRVSVRWASDAVAEADWIADRIARLHEQGVPWSEIAVLFRKNRHIRLIHDALTERDIPVEVASLGGLLGVPEVADLVAWMRLLHDPEDGPALLRILTAPRMALGLGDIALVSRRAHARYSGPVDDDPELGALPAHTIIEAIEELDDIEGLRLPARRTFERFNVTYRTLLEVAQGANLAELSRTILDVTHVWRDVEAMGEASRLSARLNLYRFLDLAEEWSPLEGRPSLGAFVGHLSVLEESPTEQMDTAKLSGEEAVALLTVHRSKGLEWDCVFVPAVARKTFPAAANEFSDPYKGGHFLPHEWRLDDPPELDGDMTEPQRKAVLRAHNLIQEWRTAYVAVTRAKHQLFLSGAHWYGDVEPNAKPTTPSDLYALVAGLPTTDDLGTAELGERPPTLRVPDRIEAPDPLFSEGWTTALRETIDRPEKVSEMAAQHGIDDIVETTTATFQRQLFDLGAVPEMEPEAERRATSVTGLVTYAACPKQYFWSEVDRLPRRPSTAALRGVDVHRRIELHSLGTVPLTEADRDTYDVVGDSVRTSTPQVNAPFHAYLASGYATRTPLQVETAFQFDTDADLTIRGRIDAIYPLDGGWEIVDFKSGRRRHEPWLGVQLAAYAVAARKVDFGLDEPASLSASFVYLGDGLEVVKTDADIEWERQAHETVEGLAADIMAERFEPVPSDACRTCEFSRFCEPGMTWLNDHDE